MKKSKDNPFKTFVLENEFLRVVILNYGARIKSVHLKKAHESHNLVVGLEDNSQYLKDLWSLGACLGPYAGRLVQNKEIILHGGDNAFSKVFWDLKTEAAIELTGEENIENGQGNIKTALSLTYHYRAAADNLISVLVNYSLKESSLIISYQAMAEQESLLNLSNHSYFVLDQQTSPHDNELAIHAQKTIALDCDLLPTGDIVPHTELFPNSKKALRIPGAKALTNNFPDTAFVLHKKEPTGTLEKAASLYSPNSGIQLEVFTDQEVLVCFRPKDFNGICFETQGYPNTSAHKHFSQPLTGPEKPYVHNSRFKFTQLKV